MWTRSFFILVVLFFCIDSVFAQDIEVKKFEPLEKDQTAVSFPRKDINGNVCGLVKVALKEFGAEFEGNVMGEVQFTGSEYLVYMPNGSKRLGIKHPDYLPTTIVFADYGTKRVASSTTYELKVKTNKKKAKIDNSKKGMAAFNIKPSNAMLFIDGEIADGSGGVYTLSLPYGTHYFTVKLNDFSINNQIVQIDKNAKNINVDLTEYFAKVFISCPTEDAELSVNGEQKGEGKWEGMMIPGKYTIEASKDGCHSQIRQIELKDNDNVTVDFTKLKTITGSLHVDFEPAGADVFLDGKKVGVTPLVLRELPVGNYHLEIWKELFIKEFAKVKIAEDQVWKENGELKLTQFGKMMVNAENNKPVKNILGNSALALAEYYRYGAAGGVYGTHWSCVKDTFHVPMNPVKAIYWLKKVVKEGSDSESKDAIEMLGPCYPDEVDEAKLSFCWAKHAVEKLGEEYKHMSQLWQFYRCPYAALAWHYFYGVGCEKKIEEAYKLMRWSCTSEGEYSYPAYIEIIKDMKLDSELKFNEKLREDDEEEFY